MSFRPPLPRIAGPHNLPTLLSTLPRHGQFSIVKPSNCKHPNRVFVVTRSKLKFSSISPAPAGAQVEALKAGGKVSAIQEEGKDKKVWVGANATEDGELRAHGKVWAMEFINGELGLAGLVCARGVPWRRLVCKVVAVVVIATAARVTATLCNGANTHTERPLPVTTSLSSNLS